MHGLSAARDDGDAGRRAAGVVGLDDAEEVGGDLLRVTFANVRDAVARTRGRVEALPLDGVERIALAEGACFEAGDVEVHAAVFVEQPYVANEMLRRRLGQLRVAPHRPARAPEDVQRFDAERRVNGVAAREQAEGAEA